MNLLKLFKRDPVRTPDDDGETTSAHETTQPPTYGLGDRDENPDGIGILSLIVEDLATHDSSLLEPGFWAIAVHRFGNWRMNIKAKPIRAPLTVLYTGLFTSVDWIWGINLPYTVKLGRRVRLWHHGGMVLGARSIGDDVHIRHNTTFGVLNREDLTSKPTIEDGVDIGAGACVVGDVTIGRDSIIGANSLVLRDIPPDSTVLGVPARPVKLMPQGSSANKGKPKQG